MLLIDSGRNTFADLRQAFPAMGNRDWCIYISDAFKILPGLSGFDSDTPKVLHFLHVPEDYSPDYKFKDSDAFALDIAGKNVLYRVKKEETAKQEAQQRHEDEMKSNREIKKLTIINITATVSVGLLGIIVAIAIAYITIYKAR